MAAATAVLQRRPEQAAAPKAAKSAPSSAGPQKPAPRSELSQQMGRVVPKAKAPKPAVPKGMAQPPVGAVPVAPGKSGLDTFKTQLKAAGSDQKTHDSAEHAASVSQKAADVTPDQAQGDGRAQQLGTIASQKKGVFNREAFKAKSREKINQLKADDAKNIKDGDKGAQVNAEVKGAVAEGQKSAAGPIDAAAKQPPPPGEPKKGEPLPKAAPGAAPKVDGGRAIPPPVPDARVSMSGEAAAIDRQMAGAKVTPRQLEKANEPAFKTAATARSKATSSAAALPGNARAKERAVLANSQAGQAATTGSGLAGMHGNRGAQLSAALAKQVAGKAKQEAARKRISAELTQIYTATKTAVDGRLAKIDDDVAKTFDDGASSAKWDFYEFLALKLLVYYATGGWAVDLITGGSSKDEIFNEGRATYMKAMDRVIDQVADVVEKGLNDVVGMIADGKKQLDAAVAKMDPSDREVAGEVASGIQAQFADLEKSVEDKQNDIIDSVAKKYVAAQKEVDATVNALRNPVGALIEMAVDAVAGVIETILKLKDLLLTALAKAREAIDLIIDDPIGFLRNLVAGVKQGINNFVTNIGTHLKKGLMEWLFGALAGAGIQMPDKFDLSGLLSIVLQVLGLTWTNIRARAVKIVGEPVVKALETASDIIKILVTKGASGLWEYIKEQAAMMLETLKDSVKTMVIENVVKAGVKWLIGLLNPASAFVKACMAIVDIVSFIIDRGQQILEFVHAVLDSVLAIAKGQIGVAAKAVEWALAKAVPVAIGFLASLLGLGDLGKDIKKVIDKIQAPVNKVIDWLINKAVGLVKAAGKLLGFGKKDDERQARDPEHDAKVERGLSELKQLETAQAVDGKLGKDAAEGIARSIRSKHSVFTSVTVGDGGDTWDFEYTASPKKVVKGKKKDWETAVVRGELLAEYAQLATAKLPSTVKDVIASQGPTAQRNALKSLKKDFDKLLAPFIKARAEGRDLPTLSAQQKEIAVEILREAREHARKDFSNVRQAVWRRLRNAEQNPELAAIEKKLRASGDVKGRAGSGALRVRSVSADKDIKHLSMNIEHRIRLSDSPWLYNSPENLLITDAPQNQQYLENLRKLGSIWPSSQDFVEEFIVRFELNDQGINFMPGERH